MSNHILAIDQGTTSSRAIVFDQHGAMQTTSQYEFPQHYPDNGWVEHNPADIWQTTLDACRDVVKTHGENIVTIGITNQRETTLLWDRVTGEPIYNAIVWQDRRTASICDALNAKGHGDTVTECTGLLIDAYFSATKIAWILDHVDGARARAQRGEILFGTMDTYLIWRFTNGQCHLTDATNASRTALFNIHSQQWDPVLLDIFDVPAAVLPNVNNSADDFGVTAKEYLGRALPIQSVVGDQQGALFGQACFSPGMLKSTYGTGCFMIMNTGDKAVASQNKLLTTVGYRINDEVTYALEGSIFNAGTAIQWIRDGIHLIDHVDEIEPLMQTQNNNDGVYMVPAFTGLGAPHWDANARGAILGITRDTRPAHLVRAALEAVCYQTLELVEAMSKDSGQTVSRLRVDGGMVNNDRLLQILSDIIDTQVDKPAIVETTALGAAYLAGLAHGIYQDQDQIAELWQCQQQYQPTMDANERKRMIEGWQQAVARVRST